MTMMIQMINAYDYMERMLPTFMVSCRKISILSRKCPTFRGTEGYAKENPIELGLPKKPRGSCGKIWGFQNSSVDFYVFLGGGKWIWDIYVYYLYIYIYYMIYIYMMVYHTYLYNLYVYIIYFLAVDLCRRLDVGRHGFKKMTTPFTSQVVRLGISNPHYKRWLKIISGNPSQNDIYQKSGGKKVGKSQLKNPGHVPKINVSRVRGALEGWTKKADEHQPPQPVAVL